MNITPLHYELDVLDFLEKNAVLRGRDTLQAPNLNILSLFYLHTGV